MNAKTFSRSSLTVRIGVGKLIGLLFGLLGFFLIPVFYPDADWQLRLGILLWYTTVGAVIGVFGVYTRHPVLHLPLPWWFRAPVYGAWMNFILTLFAHEKFQTILTNLLGDSVGIFTSPFWFVVEGAIVGFIIGWAATRLGGEGPETAGN